MNTKEQLFTDPSQLNILSTLPFMRTSGLGVLRLGGNIAEHPAKRQWETELNRNYYACGCNASAIGLMTAMSIGSVWAIYSYSQGSWTIMLSVIIVFALSIGGAFTGKIIGLIHANKKLKQIVKEIQNQWPSEKV